MAIDCLILDFDGTFTDVEREAVPFLAAYRDALGRELGPAVTRRWDEVQREIREEPDRFGWQFEGRIVAPSNADPYVLATSVAQKLLDDQGLLDEPARRRAVLERLFSESYPKAASVFRPEAKDVVERLIASGVPMFVVSNSHTDAVLRKLDELAPAGRAEVRVQGDAKKYVVAEPSRTDPVFDAVPETQRIAGLDRPIFLRRGRYYELLAAIRRETQVPPERTLVCGDIYELDLALPATMGYAVHLITRETTPRYAREAVRGLRAGAVSDSLVAMSDRVCRA